MSADTAMARIANALEKLCDLLEEEEPEPAQCRLSYPPERMQEVVDTAVSRLMQSTQHLTRSELTEIIECVFNAGVTSVVHERHG